MKGVRYRVRVRIRVRKDLLHLHPPLRGENAVGGDLGSRRDVSGPGTSPSHSRSLFPFLSTHTSTHLSYPISILFLDTPNIYRYIASHSATPLVQVHTRWIPRYLGVEELGLCCVTDKRRRRRGNFKV